MRRQWRVGTLSMGLLLIALGVIMLVSQILEISLLDQILKWWPIALIMIGLEILIYVFLSKQDEPKVKFDVFSIIIISILLMASVGVYAVTGLISSGNGVLIVDSMFDNFKNESIFTRNYEVDVSSSNLVIDNVFGNINVTKGDVEKIEVEANITIRNNDENYASEIADSLVVISNDKDIKIKTDSRKYSNKGKIGSIRIDYTIKVPDTVNVEADNQYGDVLFTDLALSGKVNNKNGKVTVESLGGDLVVDCSYGDIEVRDIKGEAEVYSKNGDIIANNCGKNIKIEGAYGDIEIDGIKGFASISNTNGVTRGSKIDGDVTVASKYGDVILTDIFGSVDVNDSNGEVSISNVGGNIKVNSAYGDTKVLNASRGIELNVTNGDITVETDKVISQDVNIKSKYGGILLKLPAAQSGYFEANTQYGDIENEFGFEVKKDGNINSMIGTLTDEKIKFNLNSSNGDINIKKID